jgi:organic hydroperoxide reductase OsmC/OhrA
MEIKGAGETGVPVARRAVQQLPHQYAVTASAAAEGDVQLQNAHLPALSSAPPAEFGGLGDRWSPEELCVGAVADCFVLTFRALARASKLPWASLRCDAEGTLDRVDRVTRFTAFLVRATLQVPAGTDLVRARQLLERTEQNCLISQSLKASSQLEATVESLP